jgi:hypothetical protein
MTFRHIFVEDGKCVVVPVHEMKAYMGMEEPLHLFLTMSLHGGPVT